MSVLRSQQLDGLLKGTSRSFYLTLRVLPGRIRNQIGLAYLLARTTDTIADTELVPLDQRLKALQALRSRILGSGQTDPDLGELSQRQTLPAEQALLKRVSETLAMLDFLGADDLKLIREVLQTISSGQELDLRRFAGGSPEHLVALQTEEELDDYTYRVAGCVGEFWTKMCRAHLFRTLPLDDSFLLAHGVRFGKGLQLVNILRDLPVDLQNGRCYLPSAALVGAGLNPADLLKPANEPRLRPIYDRFLAQAEDHLRAGWTYTNALPRRAVRVRLACAWPLLLGFRTVEMLRSANVIDPRKRVKVSRPELKRMMVRSVLLYPFPSAWRRMLPLPAESHSSSSRF